jgi:hypothetical protein
MMEVVTPLMLDGTYLSRNIATLGPFGEPDSRRLENMIINSGWKRFPKIKIDKIDKY